ncbi:membrane fusion protein, copper/silver efflux system [Gammaproteobacteria bacterium]
MGSLIATVIVLLVAGGGYWLGNQAALSRVELTSVAPRSELVQRKLLYYRNPMGLSDISSAPKKDSMGMDYVPVYEDEQNDASVPENQLKITADNVQKLGVKTELASLRSLDAIVRAAAGRIEPDERRLYTISPKFEGYIDRLYVNVTGQPVEKGQPLFEVYSPELVSAQREYAIAIQGVNALKKASGEVQASMQQLANSSLARLKNWDISEEQLKVLAKSGEAKHTLTFRSPVNGIITEKKALPGMRFMPGEVLYQIADLSTVWVIADVFESDLGLIKSGMKTKIKINAYPDQIFEGMVTYIYPILKAETRTIPVRVELANPGILIKPGMFAVVEFLIKSKGVVVTVPVSAVIDSGTRQIVFVELNEGRYEAREVKLGARGNNYVEVLEGIKDRESVVVSANFLIDAESNLKAALRSFNHTTQVDGKAVPSKPNSTNAGHRAEGTVDDIDATAGTISISHGPVESLKWPAMTMEFQAANHALLKNLKPGAPVAFEFVERKQGEWVVTSIRPISKVIP